MRKGSENMSKLQTNVVKRDYAMLCEYNGVRVRFVYSAESEEKAKLELPVGAKFIKFLEDNPE